MWKHCSTPLVSRTSYIAITEYIVIVDSNVNVVQNKQLTQIARPQRSPLKHLDWECKETLGKVSVATKSWLISKQSRCECENWNNSEPRSIPFHTRVEKFEHVFGGGFNKRLLSWPRDAYCANKYAHVNNSALSLSRLFRFLLFHAIRNITHKGYSLKCDHTTT